MVLRRIALLSLPILSLVAAGVAEAGERGHVANRPHGPHGGWSHHGSHGGNHAGNHRPRPSQSGISSSYGLPSVIPGLGTFAGNVIATRVKGVGNYFAAEGNAPQVIMAPDIRPKARIIIVGQSGNPCSYEAGVCVIRP